MQGQSTVRKHHPASDSVLISVFRGREFNEAYLLLNVSDE